jgi:predicted DNA-binding transcriptional regulator YafY
VTSRALPTAGAA